MLFFELLICLNIFEHFKKGIIYINKYEYLILHKQASLINKMKSITYRIVSNQ